MKSDYLQLLVQNSRIENAGLGVFAKNNLYKGQILAEYRGSIIPTKYAWAQCYMLEDKMVQINLKYSVISRTLASRINDIVKFGNFNKEDEEYIQKGKFRLLPNLSYNVHVEIKYDKAFIIADRDIKEGEELYFEYGYSYWRSFYDQMKQYQGDFYKDWSEYQSKALDKQYVISDSDTLKLELNKGDAIQAKQTIQEGEIVLECRGKIYDKQQIDRVNLPIENKFLRLNKLSNRFFSILPPNEESINCKVEYKDKKYFIIASKLIYQGQFFMIDLQDPPLYVPKTLRKQITMREEDIKIQVQEQTSPIRTKSFLEQVELSFEKVFTDTDSIAKTNMCYQIFQQIGWSIFDKVPDCIELDPCKNVKMQCLHFFHRLRKFFRSYDKNGCLFELLRKLERIQNQIEEEPIKQYTSIQSQNNNQDNRSQEQCSEMNIIVQELQAKIDHRDNVLQDLTYGYLKDIQHMREMLFRQSKKQKYDFIYEVQYFDEKDGFNEEQTALLNQKIELIKINFEEKTQQLLFQVQTIQNELSQWREKSNILKDKLNSLDNSTGLLNRVLQLENNDPYKVWKILQDLKGNQFFFQVFNQQKFTYGINNREIDRLLLNSKSHIRELNYYKSVIDDQVNGFMEKQITHMYELRKELEEKEKEILQLKNRNILQECQNFMINHTNKVIDEKRNEIITILFSENGELFEIKNQVDQFKAAEMLRRWSFCTRLIKLIKNHKDRNIIQNEIRHILIDQNEIKKIKNKAEEYVKIYQNLYKQLQEKFEKDKVTQLYWEYKAIEIQRNQKDIIIQIDTLKQEINQYKQENEQLKSKYMVLQQHYQLLLKLLDQKCNTITDLNVKAIEQALNKTNEFKQNALILLSNQQQEQLKQLDLFQTQVAYRSKFTQTLNIVNEANYEQNALNLLNKVINLVTIDVGTNTDQEPIQQQKIMKDVSITNTLYQHESENEQPITNDQIKKNEIISDHFSQISKQYSYHQEIKEIKQEQFEKQESPSQSINFMDAQSQFQVFQISKEDYDHYNQGSALLNQKINKGSVFRSPKKVNIRKNLGYTYDISDKTNRSEIFERLYKDSIIKRERMDILRQHIETLDQFRWEQIIGILTQTPYEIKPLSSTSKRRKSKFNQQDRQKREREDQSLDVIQHIDETNQLKKTEYYKNLLIKHKNQTKRMYGVYMRQSKTSQKDRTKDEIIENMNKTQFSKY